MREETERSRCEVFEVFYRELDIDVAIYIYLYRYGSNVSSTEGAWNLTTELNGRGDSYCVG